MQGCPQYVRGRFRQATRCALEARHQVLQSARRGHLLVQGVGHTSIWKFSWMRWMCSTLSSRQRPVSHRGVFQLTSKDLWWAPCWLHCPRTTEVWEELPLGAHSVGWSRGRWRGNSRKTSRKNAPFQFALSTRAGTDCVGHMLRAATNNDDRATILKVDGIGAYDHVLRSAMMGRLITMPKAQFLLLFVQMSYATPSSCSWFDDEGRRRVVTQAEGGEQGDPMMPLLFLVGIQGALEEVADAMRPDEQICAFLDDVYIVCQPERVRVLFDLLAELLFRVVGIWLHDGKTRMWNASGIARQCWRTWGRQCGSREESRFLALLLGHQSTPRRESRGGWRRNVCCGRPRPWFAVRMANPSFSVRIQEETGFTTKGSGTRRFGSLPTSQEVKPKGNVHASWQVFLCGWGVGVEVHESMLTRSFLGLVGWRSANDPGEPSNRRDRSEGCLSEFASCSALLVGAVASPPCWVILHAVHVCNTLFHFNSSNTDFVEDICSSWCVAFLKDPPCDLENTVRLPLNPRKSEPGRVVTRETWFAFLETKQKDENIECLPLQDRNELWPSWADKRLHWCLCRHDNKLASIALMGLFFLDTTKQLWMERDLVVLEDDAGVSSPRKRSSQTRQSAHRRRPCPMMDTRTEDVVFLRRRCQKRTQQGLCATMSRHRRIKRRRDQEHVTYTPGESDDLEDLELDRRRILHNEEIGTLLIYVMVQTPTWNHKSGEHGSNTDDLHIPVRTHVLFQLQTIMLGNTTNVARAAITCRLLAAWLSRARARNHIPENMEKLQFSFIKLNFCSRPIKIVTFPRNNCETQTLFVDFFDCACLVKWDTSCIYRSALCQLHISAMCQLFSSTSHFFPWEHRHVSVPTIQLKLKSRSKLETKKFSTKVFVWELLCLLTSRNVMQCHVMYCHALSYCHVLSCTALLCGVVQCCAIFVM